MWCPGTGSNLLRELEKEFLTEGDPGQVEILWKVVSRRRKRCNDERAAGLVGYPEEVLFDWPGMVRRALIVYLRWPEGPAELPGKA